MLQKGYERSLLFKERSEEQDKLFEIKNHCFLHNMDTFYYSIKLEQDFTKDTKDHKVLRLRKWISDYQKNIGHPVKNRLNAIRGLEDCTIESQRYGKYYDLCISKPGWFDCFIASVVPPSSDGGDSVTAEMIMQLRSDFLWQHSAQECFERSYEKIQHFLKHFGFKVVEIKENRMDFCWHSNHFVNPEKYFDIRSLHRYAVTRIHQGYMHWQDNAGSYDIDYVAYGKRSNKIFLRIYLKSKEVVEMGYKGWFLKLWQLSGMISQYDFYVLEKCYERRDWKYLDNARLLFYLDYGEDEQIKKTIKALLEEKSPDKKVIRKLADQLTPKVTKVMNVEYQVMRRASKQFALLPVADRTDKGVSSRVYEVLDNWQYITAYLTQDVFRLCNDDNERTSRRSYTDFWTRLRSAPIYAGSRREDYKKITRNYQHELDFNIMKDRFMGSAITLGMYMNGINDADILKDCIESISMLNDNDLHRAQDKKRRKVLLADQKRLHEVKQLARGMPVGIASHFDTDDWVSLIFGDMEYESG